jgi:Thioredoxin
LSNAVRFTPCDEAATTSTHRGSSDGPWPQWLPTLASARWAWKGRFDPGVVERFRRVGGDLRLLIVAEDWCPDSVHTVPYVAALAAQAGVDMRIVDRGSGAAMMKRHPAPDGRGVTPIVVLLRAVSYDGGVAA